MDDRAQDDVWGGDKILRSFISIVLATTSDAKPVKGGYRVTGRWTYGTGSLHADWSLLGIPLKDAKGAVVDAGLALIPTSELGVDDNWYVAGMKGTGSVTQVADDVFVPEHRVFPLTAAVEGKYLGSNPEQSYKTIFVPSLFMKLIGPHLGMGRAALDYVIAKADSKAVAYTGYEKQADATSFQLAVAKASVQLNAAELIAADIAGEIYDAAARGYYAPYGERIEMRAKAGWVVETITTMIHELLTAHGSSGFAIPLRCSASGEIRRRRAVMGIRSVQAVTSSMERYCSAARKKPVLYSPSSDGPRCRMRTTLFWRSP